MIQDYPPGFSFVPRRKVVVLKQLSQSCSNSMSRVRSVANLEFDHRRFTEETERGVNVIKLLNDTRAVGFLHPFSERI